MFFSDSIRHCPQQDTSFCNMLLQHFCEVIQNQDKKIQYDSIYGLAIILTSKFISSESVDSLFNNLLDRITEVPNEMRNMIVFFIHHSLEHLIVSWNCLMMMYIYCLNIALIIWPSQLNS